jgi:hypothetical protein
MGRFVAATTTLALLLALASPASAAPAQGSIYSQVLKAYENRGQVPPCQFSSQQLEIALKGINTYGAQYFADFTDAVQNALATRATGACSQGAGRAQAGGLSGAGGKPAALKFGSLTPGTSASLPLPILLMAVFGVVLAVVGAAALLARWRASGRPGRRPTAPPAL